MSEAAESTAADTSSRSSQSPPECPTQFSQQLVEASADEVAPSSSSVARRPGWDTRADFLAIVSACMPVPPQVESPGANKVQLYQAFVDHYIPKDAGDQYRPINVLITAATLSPALSKALDAVSLLVFDRVGTDPRLARAANSAYVDALRLTRQELSRRNNDKRVVIGTAHWLSMCELFRSTSLDELGARPHTRWLISYMESCRAEQQDPGIRALMESNLRLLATWEALVMRKRPCRPGELLDETGLQPDGTLATLSSLVIMVSGVLEDSDKLCQQEAEPSIPRILNLIARIVGLEGKMHDWMAEYYKNIPGCLQWTTEACQLPWPIGRGTLSLFRRVYDFSDIQTAIVHINYYLCLLVLVEAHLEIRNIHGHRQDAEYAEYMRLKRLSAEYADSLCKCMPFLGKPTNGWAGRIMAIRPLHLLLLHFRKRLDWQKLSWCVECAADLGIVRSQPNMISSDSSASHRRAAD